jgi:hypothetical protein
MLPGCASGVRRRHRAQFVDVLGAEVEALVGRVVHRLAADVRREVARGIDGRIHQHRAAARDSAKIVA